MAVDRVTKEKKKKKKVKLEDVQNAGDTNAMVCHDVSVQTVVKKEEPLDVSIRDGEKRESDAAEKKKKKKKKVKAEVEANSPVCCDTSVQTTVKTESSDINISDAPEKTKKKKKKKIKEEAEHIQEEVIVSEDGDHLVSKKKKAKKKGYEEEVEDIKKKKKKKEEQVKEEEADLGHSAEMVKKKKKKRKIDESELADGEMKKRKKQKEVDACEEVEEKVKKKNKKKKSSAEGEPDEISSNKKPEKKSKKLKKKLKSVAEGESRPHANGGQETSPDKKMKKKIKARTDAVTEIQQKPARKKGSKEHRNKTPEKVQKKTLKVEHQEAVVERASKVSDVVFLSAKPGNQDEVSIDQARRLALQRDIDKESQPKPNLGQWGTAQFDSSDRQAKFLRLMGGFKKSSQPLTGPSGQANMALGNEGQQTLQQGLLGEFERAQSRHTDFRNKGAGLGFAAPSNKKFAIDSNARNSVRFND
ncbi:lysine-rich nucleolar protein 1 [Onychostoma macrolepis]|uniref:Small acidic protein-like domain-containing protein n=1 Tax=Onychostoma macrolepis TaxID=369639 RepID=A0A7J6DG06_9TELE|nr:lysine-rich nucleolar protein 1 [Onychostoma macrolepis]XP_058632733.1 lysine-rich nucleolar protein 1 [Onychostoma macrolepis]KAF4118263.1 hypothetical protein G5714_000314 [Onychostoma macrolepis]